MAGRIGAYLDIELIGGAGDLLRMLDRLDSVFSPVGMLEFLSGDVTPWLRERARDRFAGEGDDASGPWAPLAPATVQIRAAGIARGEWPGISPEHPINRRTGDMEDYITNGIGEVASSPASTTLFYPRRRPTVKKGMDKKIKNAQTGTGKMNKRPVLAVGERDLQFVVSELSMFMHRKMNT